MRTIAISAAVCVGLGLGGCFYTDPINQRPSVEIEQLSGSQVFRGDIVNLNAITDDPDGDGVSVSWEAYACTDATPAPDGSRPGCDSSSIASGTNALFSFSTPDYRHDGATPVGAMYVTLEAVDSLGAAAQPGQELIITVADAPPVLALSAQPREGYVVNIALPIFARVGDPDDPAASVAVAWTASSPTGSEPLTTETSQPIGSDTNQLQLGTTLVPDVVGNWNVQATATDPSGSAAMQSLMLVITPDEPPCLATWAPATPPTGDVLPIDAPTLFQVLVVDDDLDPYPPVPSDPVLGTTTFAWSLLPPGATTREALSAAGAGVALDPASYQPGDIVELRVQIYDRTNTPVACDDDDPTCSIGANQCMQRLTWRVEMQ
ncbi:MAG TPA: hypothetical protein VH143_20110 [Kofleriaceae bacterium]|nr:hypothetical protein [Kofleriaceae bacterium]